MQEEPKAMQKIAEILDGFDENGRGRILQWLVSKHVGKAPDIYVNDTTSNIAPKIAASLVEIDNDDEMLDEIPDMLLAEIIAKSADQSPPARVLLAAYWMTKGTGSTWTSNRANVELSNIDKKVDHINRVIEKLKAQSPALVITASKSKGTRRDMSELLLTEEGRRKAVTLLRQSGE